MGQHGVVAGEESGGSAYGFEEVFAGDYGVVTAVVLHLFLEEGAVGVVEGVVEALFEALDAAAEGVTGGGEDHAAALAAAGDFCSELRHGQPGPLNL
ncbi:MAG: hypothetical protein R3293_15795 [Candidatus Promineifilaceae bacterium]|nr:hypothetical protein [Candidatus Promineifilaceae bacterium]